MVVSPCPPPLVPRCAGTMADCVLPQTAQNDASACSLQVAIAMLAIVWNPFSRVVPDRLYLPPVHDGAFSPHPFNRLRCVLGGLSNLDDSRNRKFVPPHATSLSDCHFKFPFLNHYFIQRISSRYFYRGCVPLPPCFVACPSGSIHRRYAGQAATSDAVLRINRTVSCSPASVFFSSKPSREKPIGVVPYAL